MRTVRAEIPTELVVAAGLNGETISVEAARLLALELYREDKELQDSLARLGVPKL